MKTLITGHKGYIGKILREKEYLYALTLDESQCFETWKSLLHEQLQFDIDTIIHVGAISDVFYKSADIFLWNYEATKHLSDVARDRNISLIFISTCAAINPLTHYGWSKKAAEDYIQLDNEKHCILRLYNVYGGEYSRPEKNHSVPEKLIQKTLKYVFYPFERDYIHSHDVVRAIKHVEENKLNGTFDVGTGNAVHVKELAELFDENFYAVTTALEILGENRTPLKLEARQKYMIPDFKCEWDVFNYIKKRTRRIT